MTPVETANQTRVRANAFVCYARADAAFMRTLVDDLGAIGHHIDVDQNIATGERWKVRIRKMIARDAYFMYFHKPQYTRPSPSINGIVGSSLGYLIPVKPQLVPHWAAFSASLAQGGDVNGENIGGAARGIRTPDPRFRRPML